MANNRRNKQSSRPEGKKNHRKTSGKDSTTGSTRNSRVDVPDDRGGTSDNDVSWYAENEYLLKDAGSLPFSNPAGVVLELPTPIAPDSAANSNLGIPAAMSIDIVPAVGDAQSSTDPINVAGRNVFGFIRANQTVSSAYNFVTAMMMILALTSCYAFYSFCTRAYGLIRTYAQRNRALPEALFRLMRLDYEDFVTNIADFRYWLNAFAEKVGALCIPASMSYTMRQLWLFQNIFLDGPTDKSQIYVYNPAGLYKYNPIGHGSGASATPCLDMIPIVKRSGNLLKVADLIAIGNELIEPLFNNNVINTISGDILKAYGPDRVWRLLPIHEDYEVVPVLNSEVLDQIHNLFVPYGIAMPGNDCVWEEALATGTSFIKCKYQGTDATSSSDIPAATKRMFYFGAQGLLLDFDKVDISPADVMVATRLTTMPLAFGEASARSLGKFTRLLCGSEVVVGLRTIRRTHPTASSTPVWDIQDCSCFEVAATQLGLRTMRPFYKHPLNYALANQEAFVNCDVENYTIMRPDVLRKLHETALLSEFHVPLMGRLIK